MRKYKVMLSINILLVLFETAAIVLLWLSKRTVFLDMNLVLYSILLGSILNVSVMFFGIIQMNVNRRKWIYTFIGSFILLFSQLAWLYQKSVGNSIYIPTCLKGFLWCLTIFIPYLLLWYSMRNICFIKENDRYKLTELLDLVIFVLSVFIVVPDFAAITGFLFNVNIPHDNFIISTIYISVNNMHQEMLFLDLLLFSLTLYSALFYSKKVNKKTLRAGVLGVLTLGAANVLSFYYVSSGLEHLKDIIYVMIGLSIGFISMAQTFELMYSQEPNNFIKPERDFIKTILPYFVILQAMVVHYFFIDSHSITLLDISDNFLLIFLGLARGLIRIKESMRLKEDIQVREALYQEKVAVNYILENELAAEKEEVDRARQVHSKILPNNNNLIMKGIQIVGGNIPAKELGGDYYDIFQLDDSRILIVLCDVMGKGLSAAMLTVLVKNTIKHMIDKFFSASTLLNMINEELFEDLYNMKSYVTMFAVVCDLNSRELTYSCAGHNPMVIVRGNGREDCLLRTKGTAIGLKKDANYTEGMLQIYDGDIICIYSDGLTDAQNSKKERYGSQMLISVIENNKDQEPNQLKETIMQDVKTFSENEPQRDDITLVIIKALT